MKALKSKVLIRLVNLVIGIGRYLIVSIEKWVLLNNSKMILIF